MPWGYGGWGGYRYGGYSRQPGKKATAKSLSTSTLQKIIDQQKAEEAATARYYQQLTQQRAKEEARRAEEARLEELHGGKEALAKWREENAERLEVERQAKLAAERKAAGEMAIIKEMAALRAELAALPAPAAALFGARTGANPATFAMNKGKIKSTFHLTDKDLESLPKTVVQKDGAKKPSAILWQSADIMGAVARKEGKKKLRAYLTAYDPAVARAVIDDELTVLSGKHPELIERGRQQAVLNLRESDDAAIAAAKEAEDRVEAAIKALEQAREKQVRARAALLTTATADEVRDMCLMELPGDEYQEVGGPEDDDDDGEDDVEEEKAAAAKEADAVEDEGYRSTNGKAPVSRTPNTAATQGPAKKARVGGSRLAAASFTAGSAAPSSAGGAGSSSDPPPKRPSRPGKEAGMAAARAQSASLEVD